MAYEFLNIANTAIVFSGQLSTTWPPTWYITEKSGHKRHMLFEISILKHRDMGASALGITFIPFTFMIGLPWLCTFFDKKTKTTK